jgi:hypothetical protein
MQFHLLHDWMDHLVLGDYVLSKLATGPDTLWYAGWTRPRRPGPAGFGHPPGAPRQTGSHGENPLHAEALTSAGQPDDRVERHRHTEAGSEVHLVVKASTERLLSGVSHHPPRRVSHPNRAVAHILGPGQADRSHLPERMGLPGGHAPGHMPRGIPPCPLFLHLSEHQSGPKAIVAANTGCPDPHFAGSPNP